MNTAIRSRRSSLSLLGIVAVSFLLVSTGGCDRASPKPAANKSSTPPAPSAPSATAPTQVQAPVPPAPAQVQVPAPPPPAPAQVQTQAPPPPPQTTAPAATTTNAAQPVDPSGKEPGVRKRRKPPGDVAPTPHLLVRRVSSVPDVLTATDAIWTDVIGLEVVLQPQATTTPMLAKATVNGVEVRSITDGKRIVWRFSWADEHPSSETETGRFSDALGIQFPLAPDAPYLMGGPGLPVYSLYWKAQWQRDIDKGFVDVEVLYPNAWTDLYWFSKGNPARYPAAFEDKRSHHWLIGISAGNPMSVTNRTSPVEETTAEGFGSLTHIPDGIANGRGTWKDGRWGIVIYRQLRDDQLSTKFAPSAKSQFAVAVWDDNAGGRKHHSLWVDYEVDK